MTCHRCNRPLQDCPGCDGGRFRGIAGKLSCSKCNSTGLVCPVHGGYWK